MSGWRGRVRGAGRVLHGQPGRGPAALLLGVPGRLHRTELPPALLRLQERLVQTTEQLHCLRREVPADAHVGKDYIYATPVRFL